MEIENLFNSFVRSNSTYIDGNRFYVHSIEGMEHKIGKSPEDFPKVFVATNATKYSVANLNGELISVEYNVLCKLIDDSNAITEKNYSIITLRSNDTYLCKIFFEVFILSLLTLPTIPSDHELSLKIEGLLSIFAALKRPPLHKIQGLWAELMVIENSNNPTEIAKAWHSSQGAKYDFTKGTNKIEVKSTSQECRIHKFSLDQLNSSPSTELLIASVIVRESAKDENGLSIGDLYKKINNKISDIVIRMHVYSVIIETVGSEYEKAETLFFDYSSGRDSLAYYDYKDIPHIDKSAVPAFVSAVKFNADLTHIQDVNAKGITFDPNSLFANL